MTIKFDACQLEHREDGKTWLLLRPTPDTLFEARHFFAKAKDKERVYDAELKPHYEKRSESANAYMWVLCDKIADALRSTKIEIYREIIQRVGRFHYSYAKVEDAPIEAREWENKGDGWIAEFIETRGDYVTIRKYTGSSKYNTAEMGRLIDEVVSECQELGIETKTPDEIAKMVSLWGEK